MNLIEAKPKKKSDRTFIGAVAFLSVIVASLLVATVQSVNTVSSRPLEVEEKEVLVFALERLETHVPKLGEWTSEFKEELVKGSLPIYLSNEKGLTEKCLVENLTTGVAVSPLFFASDPITQENQLMQLMADRNASMKMPPEVAVAPEN